MSASDLLARWPGAVRGAVIVHHDPDGRIRRTISGADAAMLPWASVTKVAVAMAVMVAVDEGLLSLEDDAGPPGSTVRHLLAHASGLGPDGPTLLAAPGQRRIYSNWGYELLGSILERWAGIDIATYVDEVVLAPLGMERTTLDGSPASGMIGPLAELASLLAEVMAPTLVRFETAAEMRNIQWPELIGVLPGFGRFDPCPWGLGLEVKGTKAPHWTGVRWGPDTVGHFGQSGSFLVADAERHLGVATLGDEPFGPWAAAAWPQYLDAVLGEQDDET